MINTIYLVNILSYDHEHNYIQENNGDEMNDASNLIPEFVPEESDRNDSLNAIFEYEEEDPLEPQLVANPFEYEYDEKTELEDLFDEKMKS